MLSVPLSRLIAAERGLGRGIQWQEVTVTREAQNFFPKMTKEVLVEVGGGVEKR